MLSLAHLSGNCPEISGFGFLSVLQLALVPARQLATGNPLRRMMLALISAASDKCCTRKNNLLRSNFTVSDALWALGMMIDIHAFVETPNGKSSRLLACSGKDDMAACGAR